MEANDIKIGMGVAVHFSDSNYGTGWMAKVTDTGYAIKKSRWGSDTVTKSKTGKAVQVRRYEMLVPTTRREYTFGPLTAEQAERLPSYQYRDGYWVNKVGTVEVTVPMWVKVQAGDEEAMSGQYEMRLSDEIEYTYPRWMTPLVEAATKNARQKIQNEIDRRERVAAQTQQMKDRAEFLEAMEVLVEAGIIQRVPYLSTYNAPTVTFGVAAAKKIAAMAKREMVQDKIEAAKVEAEKFRLVGI